MVCFEEGYAGPTWWVLTHIVSMLLLSARSKYAGITVSIVLKNDTSQEVDPGPTYEKHLSTVFIPPFVLEYHKLATMTE